MIAILEISATNHINLNHVHEFEYRDSLTSNNKPYYVLHKLDGVKLNITEPSTIKAIRRWLTLNKVSAIKGDI